MLSLYFCRTVRVDCPVFIWRHTVKDEKIKVLALLPMELPKEIELDNTLEANAFGISSLPTSVKR